jgi:hypothetical protein
VTCSTNWATKRTARIWAILSTLTIIPSYYPKLDW